jgi:hypothetical protein
MKLRTLLILIVGLAIGYKLARRATQDDPLVVKGPQRDQGTPRFRLISGSAQRLADRATGRSLEAIRGARLAMQNKLADSQEDAAWN